MDREVLHVIPQEFIVDEQGGIKNPVGMVGVRLEAEAHIITGAVTSAQNIVKCVNRAGFKVNDIVLEPLASSKAVLTGDERELGVLLIDLGGGTTDVLVHLEGAPYHTEVLSIGGEQVTNDLSIMLKTPLEVAEKVKKEHGCCYAALGARGRRGRHPGRGRAAAAQDRSRRADRPRSSSPAWPRSSAWCGSRSSSKGYLHHPRRRRRADGRGFAARRAPRSSPRRSSAFPPASATPCGWAAWWRSTQPDVRHGGGPGAVRRLPEARRAFDWTAARGGHSRASGSRMQRLVQGFLLRRSRQTVRPGSREGRGT